MGVVGTYVSAAGVFWLTAALTAPAVAALTRIRLVDRAPCDETVQVPPTAVESGAFRSLLTDRGVLIFSACCALFALSNAAMLPLAGIEATENSGEMANLVIAACIVAPQLVVAVISPWIGRLAERRGRRVVLLLGLGALPLRGLLLSMMHDPVSLVLIQALDGVSAATLGLLLPLFAADLTRGTARFSTCMGIFGLGNGYWCHPEHWSGRRSRGHLWLRNCLSRIGRGRICCFRARLDGYAGDPTFTTSFPGP